MTDNEITAALHEWAAPHQRAEAFRDAYFHLCVEHGLYIRSCGCCGQWLEDTIAPAFHLPITDNRGVQVVGAEKWGEKAIPQYTVATDTEGQPVKPLHGYCNVKG